MLIALRQMPLTAEVYRFLVSVGGEPPVTLDIPVLIISKCVHGEIHELVRWLAERSATVGQPRFRPAVSSR